MAFNAQPAIAAMQNWYGPNFGLYKLDSDSLNVPGLLSDLGQAASFDPAWVPYSLRWWHSANATGALIDYMLTTGDHSYLPVLDGIFNNAQNAWTVDVTSQINIPTVNPFGLGQIGGGSIPTGGFKYNFTNFLNHYYDDEGWWALAWIKAFDLTQNQKYLNMAVTIGLDMTKGWDTVFGGGIYWSKDHSGPIGAPYKNAIANELFMAVTARLYLRTKDPQWKNWALQEFTWFYNSGLIWGTASNQSLQQQNAFLINDSLETSGVNDGKQTVWTYNQGVILGALCDLSIIFGDQVTFSGKQISLLPLAKVIADTAIGEFSNTGDAKGILFEANDPTYPSSIDHVQFKGVLIRNMATLFAYGGGAQFSELITANATSVLAGGNFSSQFGAFWSGSPDQEDFVRQSAAMDAINAANRVLLFSAPISVAKTLALVGLKPAAGLRSAISWLTPSVRSWAITVLT
jgi:hypothetical protein